MENPEELPRPNGALKCEHRRQGDALIFSCSGAFSLANHVKLDQILDLVKTTDAKRIVLDLREITYMDSVGVGTVAMIVKQTMNSRKRVLLLPSPAVQGMLASASLDRVIPLYDTLDKALDARA